MVTKTAFLNNNTSQDAMGKRLFLYFIAFPSGLQLSISGLVNVHIFSSLVITSFNALVYGGMTYL